MPAIIEKSQDSNSINPKNKQKAKPRVVRIVSVESLAEIERDNIPKLFLYVKERIDFILTSKKYSLELKSTYLELKHWLMQFNSEKATKNSVVARLAGVVAGILLYCMNEVEIRKAVDNYSTSDSEKWELLSQYYGIKTKVNDSDKDLLNSICDLQVAIENKLASIDLQELCDFTVLPSHLIRMRRQLSSYLALHQAFVLLSQDKIEQAKKNSTYIDWNYINAGDFSMASQQKMQYLLQNDNGIQLDSGNNVFIFSLNKLDNFCKFIATVNCNYYCEIKQIITIKESLVELVNADPSAFFQLIEKLQSQDRDLIYDLCCEVKLDKKESKSVVDFFKAIYQIKNNVFLFDESLELFNQINSSALLERLNFIVEGEVTQKMMIYGGDISWKILREHPSVFKKFSLVSLIEEIIKNKCDAELFAKKILSESLLLDNIKNMTSSEAMDYLSKIFLLFINNESLLVKIWHKFIDTWIGIFTGESWAILLLKSKLSISGLMDFINRTAWDKIADIIAGISLYRELYYPILSSVPRILQGVNVKKLIQYLLCKENCLNEIADEQLLLLLNEKEILTGVMDFLLKSSSGFKFKMRLKILRLILSRVSTHNLENEDLCIIINTIPVTDLMSVIHDLLTLNNYQQAKSILATVISYYKNDLSYCEDLFIGLKKLNSVAAQLFGFLYVIQNKSIVSQVIAFEPLKQLLNSGPIAILKIMPLEQINFALEKSIEECADILPDIVVSFNRNAALHSVKQWYLLKRFALSILNKPVLISKLNYSQFYELIERFTYLEAASQTPSDSNPEKSSYYLSMLAAARQSALKQEKTLSLLSTVEKNKPGKYLVNYLVSKINKISTGDNNSNLRLLLNTEQKKLISGEKLGFFTLETVELFLRESEVLPIELLPFIKAYLNQLSPDVERMHKIYQLLAISQHNVLTVYVEVEKNNKSLAAIFLYVIFINYVNSLKTSIPPLLDISKLLRTRNEEVLTPFIALISTERDERLAVEFIKIFLNNEIMQIYCQDLLLMLVQHDTSAFEQLLVTNHMAAEYFADHWNFLIDKWFDNLRNMQKSKADILQIFVKARIHYCKGKFNIGIFKALIEKAALSGMNPQEIFKMVTNLDDCDSELFAQDLLRNWRSYAQYWLSPREKTLFLHQLYHSEWLHKSVLKTLQPLDFYGFKQALCMDMFSRAPLPSEALKLCNDMIFKSNTKQIQASLLETACQPQNLWNLQQNTEKLAKNSIHEFDKFKNLIKQFLATSPLIIQEKTVRLMDYILQASEKNSGSCCAWPMLVLAEIIKEPCYLQAVSLCIHANKKYERIDFEKIPHHDLAEALYHRLEAKKTTSTPINTNDKYISQSLLKSCMENKTSKHHNTVVAFKHACTKQERLKSQFSWMWRWLYDMDLFNFLDSGDEFFNAVGNRLIKKRPPVKKNVSGTNLITENIFQSPLLATRRNAANDVIAFKNKLVIN